MAILYTISGDAAYSVVHVLGQCKLFRVEVSLAETGKLWRNVL